MLFRVLIKVSIICILSAVTPALAQKPPKVLPSQVAGNLIVTYKIKESAQRSNFSPTDLLLASAKTAGANPKKPKLIKEFGGYTKVLIKIDKKSDVAEIAKKLLKDKTLKRSNILVQSAGANLVIQSKPKITSWTAAEELISKIESGEKVINLGFVSEFNDTSFNPELKYAVEKDVFVIAPAGDLKSSKKFYPAALPNIFSVTAATSDLKLALESNFGKWISVAAAVPDKQTVNSVNATQRLHTTLNKLISVEKVSGTESLKARIKPYIQELKNSKGKPLSFGVIDLEKLEASITAPTPTPTETPAIEETPPGDLCPNDLFKESAGTCGCGTEDSDLDSNGIVDCLEDKSGTEGLSSLDGYSFSLSSAAKCEKSNLGEGFCAANGSTKVASNEYDTITAEYDMSFAPAGKITGGVELNFSEKEPVKYFDASMGFVFSLRSLGLTGSLSGIEITFEDSASITSQVKISGISNKFKIFKVLPPEISSAAAAGFKINEISKIKFSFSELDAGGKQGKGILQIRLKGASFEGPSENSVREFEPCISGIGTQCLSRADTVTSVYDGENGQSFNYDLSKGEKAGITYDFSKDIKGYRSAAYGILIATNSQAKFGISDKLFITLKDVNGKSAEFELNGAGITLTNFLVLANRPKHLDLGFDFNKIKSLNVFVTKEGSGEKAKGNIFIAGLNLLKVPNRVEIGCSSRNSPIQIPVSGSISKSPKFGAVTHDAGASVATYTPDLTKPYDSDFFKSNSDEEHFSLSFEGCESAPEALTLGGAAAASPLIITGNQIPMPPFGNNVGPLDDRELEGYLIKLALSLLEQESFSQDKEILLSADKSLMKIQISVGTLPLEGDVKIKVSTGNPAKVDISMNLRGDLSTSYVGTESVTTRAQGNYDRSLSFNVSLSPLPNYIEKTRDDGQVDYTTKVYRNQTAWGTEDWRNERYLIKIDMDAKWLKQSKKESDFLATADTYSNERSSAKEELYAKDGQRVSLIGFENGDSRSNNEIEENIIINRYKWKVNDNPVLTYDYANKKVFTSYEGKRTLTTHNITEDESVRTYKAKLPTAIRVQDTKYKDYNYFDSENGSLASHFRYDSLEHATFNPVTTYRLTNDHEYYDTYKQPVAEAPNKGFSHRTLVETFDNVTGSRTYSKMRRISRSRHLSTGGIQSDAVETKIFDSGKEEAFHRHYSILERGEPYGFSCSYGETNEHTRLVGFTQNPNPLDFVSVFNTEMPASTFPGPNGSLLSSVKEWQRYCGNTEARYFGQPSYPPISKSFAVFDSVAKVIAF